MKPESRKLKARAIACVLIAATLALGACDPCSGIASCNVAPTVSASGQVIDYLTGRPVAGTIVTFSPAAGSKLSGIITATTDAAGQFQLSGVATADGAVTGDISVRAPTFPAGYTIHGFQLATSRVHGNGVDLGRLLAQPFFAFLGQVQLRFANTRVVGTVRIQRVGGASLTNNDITVATDTLGLFYVEYAASSADDLVANVTITGPGLAQATVFQGTDLPVIWRDQVPSVNRVFSLGQSLAYVVQAIHRGLDRGVPGVQFSWTRTGGIGTTPASLSGLSNEIGLFSLQTVPSGSGTVTGNLVMTPPAPNAPQVFNNIQLQTFDSDSLRLLATYRFGQEAHYVGQLFNRATGALETGVPVDFIPTGGVAAQSRTDTSNSVGRFLIAPYTDQIGIIVGNLVIHYRPPRAPEVVTGLRLQTYEDDVLRYTQVYGVGPSLLYGGILMRADTGEPIVGAQLTFQRTGGIAVTPDPFTSTSIPGGLFALYPSPSTDGEVQGILKVHAPPLRDTSFTITMPTFLADSMRLFGVFRIAP
ncbi:MAG TPA: hypothetical protein VGQ30_11640, partial [Gemmatimonadaceae bacterium]|jgi:hypothetical protein|nr:hypothetical protein [Gemmatimonadaceae bacterium]